ncbi:unnamed protein product [Withania somnifera]
MGNCCCSRGQPNNNEHQSTGKSNTRNGDHHQSSVADNSNNVHKQQRVSVTPPKSPDPSSKPSKRSPIGPVLGRPMEDVRKTYYIGKELGRGQFGVTHLCTQKQSGEQFACKTIAKRKLVSKEDIEDLKREVQIMHHLTGQQNIVELKGAYEDKNSVHLVMEFCAGGELFDRIIAKGHYTERAAANLLRTIVQIVHTCHSMGIIHRDLKPENFLLLNKDENSPLKATDFGLSVFYKQGDVFKDIVGSAYYIAPEVLKRRYGPEVDIWSVGVMLYILLAGVPPFWAAEHGIFNAILRGHIDFSSDPWPSISHGAKDIVGKMLTSDPKREVNKAIQVLNGDAPDVPLDNAVLSEAKTIRSYEQFQESCSPAITLEELKRGLAKQGTKLSDYEIQQLMEAVDADGNGTIDYEEFITATMHMNRMDKEHLYTAFQYFDKDNKELEQALRKFDFDDGKDIKEIVAEVDSNNFAAMMKKGTPDTANLKKRRESFVA